MLGGFEGCVGGKPFAQGKEGNTFVDFGRVGDWAVIREAAFGVLAMDWGALVKDGGSKEVLADEQVETEGLGRGPAKDCVDLNIWPKSNGEQVG